VEDSDSTKNILIIGGGFVGLTLAAKILKTPDTIVTILESNPKKILNFRNSEFGIFEPGLNLAFEQAYASNRIEYRSLLDKQKFEMAFICVNTNKFQKNRQDVMKTLIEEVLGNIVLNGSIYIRSTVPVGTTASIQKSLVDPIRADINLFYAPERTAEGVALKELDDLPQVLGSVYDSQLDIGLKNLQSLGFSVIETSSSETAEFVKLIGNVWRDSMFAVVNEFALFAEQLKLNIYEIIQVANFKYPRGLIPYPGPVGGPCLSKDTYLFLESFQATDENQPIIIKARETNEEIIRLAFLKISEYLDKNLLSENILFIGGAFKGNPRTNDVRNGLTQELVSMLDQFKSKIKIWDPTLTTEDLLENSSCYTKSLNDIKSEIVIIGNNSNLVFGEFVFSYLKQLPSSVLIIDMFGVTVGLDLVANTYRFGIGK
jgi:UDP-N-acetyl-D-mannosaminuronic acid dehydrogenase